MRPLRAAAQRGVSLIEALVALAIMAFGMLGVVGVQATLRQNADIARQRSEAVRIAQEQVENWRGFAALPADASPGATYNFGNLADLTLPAVAGNNASYTLTQAVDSTATDDSTPARVRYKVLTVDVGWVDRNNQSQAVRLSSAINGVAPELAGTLGMPALGTPTQQTGGRNRSIPLQARDLGNGTSAFMPPQGGNVALVFNNTSGVVSVCQTTAASTAALTTANITACNANPAQLLSGFVRFARPYTVGAPALTAADSESPAGTALNLDIAITLTSTGNPSPGSTCFDDAPATSALAVLTSAVSYYCVVYSNSSGQWSGTADVAPAGLDGGPAWTLAAAGAGNYKVCRYTVASTDTAPNTQHPRTYLNVTAATLLTNQNFLVISAADSCPTDVAANPGAGDFVDSNTLQHQP